MVTFSFGSRNATRYMIEGSIGLPVERFIGLLRQLKRHIPSRENSFRRFNKVLHFNCGISNYNSLLVFNFEQC